MVKKVLFVSFLTLALCFCLPTDKPVDQVTTSKQNEAVTEPHHIIETSTKPQSTTAVTHLEPSPNIEANSKNPTKPEIPVQSGLPINVKNNTADTINNNTAASTEKAQTTVTPTTSSVIPPTTTNATTMVPTSTAAPKTTEKTANTTTVKPMSTTAVPVTAASTAGGFHGASFIGGIILTLGLLAFGFVGFKYYRTQTERNYHTL